MHARQAFYLWVMSPAKGCYFFFLTFTFKSVIVDYPTVILHRTYKMYIKIHTHIYIIFITPRIIISKFAYSIKFILIPQIKTCSAFTVTCKHAANRQQKTWVALYSYILHCGQTRWHSTCGFSSHRDDQRMGDGVGESGQCSPSSFDSGVPGQGLNPCTC
jgi:hypothetical protein